MSNGNDHEKHSAALSRTKPEHLSTADLVDRVRDRAHRIDRLGSSHSNTARALAKDALVLANRVEREVWRFPAPEPIK